MIAIMYKKRKICYMKGLAVNSKIWYSKKDVFPLNDAWLSLVERCVRDAEAAGSNPVASMSKTPKSLIN